VSEKTPRETPHLGIFWVVQTTDGKAKLLTTGCPLDQAEPYGDCLTYGPGHYETWTQWRRDKAVDPALRAMVGSYEYNGWPRGTKPAEQRSGAKAPETALSTTRVTTFPPHGDALACPPTRKRALFSQCLLPIILSFRRTR
jgi:hypothetical protein